MFNILIVHADLGAAKNIVKNICLLDKNVHFPVSTNDRLNFLLNIVYPKNYSDWFIGEYAVKDYESFGIKIIQGDATIDGIKYPDKKLLTILEKQNYILDLYNFCAALEATEISHCQVLGIIPTTTLGLNWQVRAYVMKKQPHLMHNFTFINRDNIQKYIEKYSLHDWILANLTNFYESVARQSLVLKSSNIPCISLEHIIYPTNWYQLIENLNEYFHLNIPKDQALELLNHWNNLHWNIDDTNIWQYNNIFLENRNQEVIQALMRCQDFEK